MAAGNRGFVKRRTSWLLALFTLLFIGIGARLAQIQLVQGIRYTKWVKAIRSRTIPIPATRGGIFDRTGRPLAMSIETASVFADKDEVQDPTETAQRVAAILGGDSHALELKLTGRGHKIWLGRNLDPRLGDEVRRGYKVMVRKRVGSGYKMVQRYKSIPGVGVERDSKRIYPDGVLAANVLGFTRADNSRGVEGLEGILDDELAGKEGKFRADLDGERRVIPETRRVIKQPEQGKNVHLTIDGGIQHIAEQALGGTVKKYKPSSACAIVMDPHTGEILALANYPSFDPNKPRESGSKNWRNRAVADLYEPGSTLKAVTVAAALNEGFSEYQVFANCTGRENIAGGHLKCVLHYPFGAGHGGVDMYKIIQQSCNIGAAHIALRLGARKLYEYEKAFGLLEKINAGFGCEAKGYAPSVDDWGPMRAANVGFGQGISTTALEMASVYCTIANGGVRVEPQIIREIRNADGSIYKAFKVRGSRRVISQKAAFTTTKTLMSCVQVGTGKPAKIIGRSVAGKTGSAQIAMAKGGYESGAFIASFIGFAPAKNPRLVIAVVVNRPQGSHWGAAVAAPAFQEIGEKSLWYLKVPSDEPQERNPSGKPGGARAGLA